MNKCETCDNRDYNQYGFYCSVLYPKPEINGNNCSAYRGGKNMKKYYVTTTKNGDEFTILKTDNLKEAKVEALNETRNKYNDTVEIRVYAEDIEDESCANFDYDTVEISWYAVMNAKDDTDWGYGSVDLTEAQEMAKKISAHHIEKVVGDVCEEVIEIE